MINLNHIAILEECEEQLRSALSIARRRGVQTNWDAYENSVLRLLGLAAAASRRHFSCDQGHRQLVALARDYLAKNAAESGADELIRALADAVSQTMALYDPIDRVLSFDWSSNDSDAVAAIEELRRVRNTMEMDT